MKKRSTLLVSAGALGAVGLSVIAVSGSWAGPSPEVSATPNIRAMSATQQVADKLPEMVATSEHLQHLDKASSQAFKSADDNSFWAVKNTDGEICLVGMTPDEVAGTTCATPYVFNTQGLAVQVFSESEALEAYLVPDGVAGGTNLISVDPLTTEREQAVQGAVSSDAAKSANFELKLLPAPSSHTLPPALQKKIQGD